MLSLWIPNVWVSSTISIIWQDILEVMFTHLVNYCFRLNQRCAPSFFRTRKLPNAKLRLNIETKTFTFVPSFPLILQSWWLWKYAEPKIAALQCQVSPSHFQANGELTDTRFTSLVFVNIQWNDFIPSIISGESWQNSMVIKLGTDGNC